MVHCGSHVLGAEKMDTVQIGDVDAAGVGRRTVRAVLLHVHPEEAHVVPVNVLEGEDGFGAERESLGNLLGGTEFVLHPRLDLHGLVAAGQHTDRHLAGLLHVLALQVVVDVRLDELAQFRCG